MAPMRQRLISAGAGGLPESGAAFLAASGLPAWQIGLRRFSQRRATSPVLELLMVIAENSQSAERRALATAFSLTADTLVASITTTNRKIAATQESVGLERTGGGVADA